MGAAIGEVLGLAAGVAVSPLPNGGSSGHADQRPGQPARPAHLQADLDDAVDAFTAGERHTPPFSTGSPLGG